MISIDDDTPPVLINCPTELVTVNCIDEIPAVPDVKAEDNCMVTVAYKEEKDGDEPCDFVITRTWTATDMCGNTAQCRQIIKVVNDIDVEASVDDNTLCKREVQIFGNASGGCGNYSYKWSGPSGFSSNDQNPIVSVVGTYVLTVSDEQGCTDTDEVTLTNDECMSIGSTVFVDNNNNSIQG